MCECFTVGGRFIAEDPDCPTHGVEAQRDAARAEWESQAKDARIAELEQRIEELENQISILHGY